VPEEILEETLDERYLNAPILIVDDQEVNLRLLELVMQQAGYNQIALTTDPREVVPLFTSFKPDLLLLDLHMPHLDGYAVMEQLKPHLSPDTYFPILVLTADITSEAKQRALTMGARDFLVKPFDITEVLLRIRNLLETRFLHLQLQNQNQLLEEKVRERTRELEDAQVEIIERLARAAEYRDDATGRHTQRVGRLSSLIAEAMGMPREQVELIRLAAPLHDLGKIGISDSILLKPGKLTQEELVEMRTHVTIGASILSGSRHALLKMAEEIAFSHHIHWDGNGYPDGIYGEYIPLPGRIVAVADFFDALLHDRPYKKAWPVEEVIAEIKRQIGRQFDPGVVEALLKVLNSGKYTV